ncbi:succinate dehydrogenase assembly factor 2 [Luteimonas deserti]|uniref:FAD assembly factor SdhE n=1 Tax=Luteimonas deserti TaxID=2752306 RepID=A0A7Z0QSZ1_9GAMM|nr:succinate dehydrogenase assembly factor 2 [Luteimonas deserti]NYZ64198.1 succinate dehydrogenase assembly factor 2 [Luteimonas deserti]
MTDRDTPLSDTAELRRLRWRARRGMRELDQLFERWLDQRWSQSPEAGRAVFRRLLDCEDDRLWKWFLGQERPGDVELDALVAEIRSLPHDP